MHVINFHVLGIVTPTRVDEVDNRPLIRTTWPLVRGRFAVYDGDDPNSPTQHPVSKGKVLSSMTSSSVHHTSFVHEWVTGQADHVNASGVGTNGKGGGVECGEGGGWRLEGGVGGGGGHPERKRTLKFFSWAHNDSKGHSEKHDK